MHLTGGVTGFIGAYLVGPRVGLFSSDSKYSYILDEQNFVVSDDEDSESELPAIEQELMKNETIESSQVKE